jgi:hypothetical protein
MAQATNSTVATDRGPCLARGAGVRSERTHSMASETWPEKVGLIGVRLQRAAVAGLARGTP